MTKNSQPWLRLILGVIVCHKISIFKSAFSNSEVLQFHFLQHSRLNIMGICDSKKKQSRKVQETKEKESLVTKKSGWCWVTLFHCVPNPNARNFLKKSNSTEICCVHSNRNEISQNTNFLVKMKEKLIIRKTVSI